MHSASYIDDKNIRLQQTIDLQQPLNICFQIYNFLPFQHPANTTQLNTMYSHWHNNSRLTLKKMRREVVRTKTSRPGLEDHHHELSHIYIHTQDSLCTYVVCVWILFLPPVISQQPEAKSMRWALHGDQMSPPRMKGNWSSHTVPNIFCPILSKFHIILQSWSCIDTHGQTKTDASSIRQHSYCSTSLATITRTWVI
jgi:hypothetical protein